MSARQKIIELVSELIPETGEFTSREVAHKALAQLEEQEPEALAEWQRETTLDLLTNLVSDINVERRSRFRQAAKRQAFQQTAQDLAGAESEEARREVVDIYRQSFVVDADNTRKPLAEMTRQDHLFVADGYKESASYSLLQEAFHREIARRIGKKTTGEVFTGEKLMALYEATIQKRGTKP